MIGYLRGKLAIKDPTFVIIDVSGIGYEVKISLNTFSKIKHIEECQLFTHLHIKEDAHTLYGFYEQAEKSIFLHLISISGVGPGTGIMIISSLTVDEIRRAIIREDVKTFQQVKGVGNKTAQRIILELKDKLKKENMEEGSVAIGAKNYNTLRNEALSALLTLGINKIIAEKSLDAIINDSDGNISLEDLIKLALKRS